MIYLVSASVSRPRVRLDTEVGWKKWSLTFL